MTESALWQSIFGVMHDFYSSDAIHGLCMRLRAMSSEGTYIISAKIAMLALQEW